MQKLKQDRVVVPHVIVKRTGSQGAGYMRSFRGSPFSQWADFCKHWSSSELRKNYNGATPGSEHIP